MIISRILLVDDEPRVTAALRRALHCLQHEIHTAESAKAGLDILKETEFDVVISDEQMPGMSGSDFLVEVRRLYPSTIRIILTGQASVEAAIHSINDGEVYRFFTKPFDPKELKVTLRQAVLHKHLANRSRDLLQKFRKQSALIEALTRTSPDLLRISLDDSDNSMVPEVDDDMEELLDDIRGLFGQA